MEREKAETFMQANSVLFPASKMAFLTDALASKDEKSSSKVLGSTFKQPVVALVLSLVFGTLGVDRFYIGDTIKGVIKLLTCGGVGIWAIIDWFLIMDLTREKNADKLLSL